MKKAKRKVVVNTTYQPGDPRRREPGPNSLKRMGKNWRERWHRTLDSSYFREVAGE